MYRSKNAGNRESNLFEVVIVVVTIAILAAVSVPQRSEGSRGLADSTVGRDLAVLRNAIDEYSTEHGGTFPTAADIVAQLTKYTDIAGQTSPTRTATHIYGPYIRSIPALPVGPAERRGSSGIGICDADGIGWIYAEASGQITANTDAARDEQNRPYCEY